MIRDDSWNAFNFTIWPGQYETTQLSGQRFYNFGDEFTFHD